MNEVAEKFLARIAIESEKLSSNRPEQYAFQLGSLEAHLKILIDRFPQVENYFRNLNVYKESLQNLS